MSLELLLPETMRRLFHPPSPRRFLRVIGQKACLHNPHLGISTCWNITLKVGSHLAKSVQLSRTWVNLCPGQLVPSNQASPRARTCAWTCWMSLASAWRGDGRAWADCATRHRTPKHRGPSRSRARWFGPGHRPQDTRLPSHASGDQNKTSMRYRPVAIL